MADKPISYYAFEILYWTGIREGELLALTPNDFDFTKKTLRINKSYQRLEGKDVITDPKTPKSNRVIVMPDFLALEIEDFISRLDGIEMMIGFSPFQKVICITRWTEAQSWQVLRESRFMDSGIHTFHC